MPNEIDEPQKHWYDKIPFARLAIIFVIVFLLSTGLCGMGFFYSLSEHSGQDLTTRILNSAFPVAMIFMALSGIGLIMLFVAFLWSVIQRSIDKNPN